MSTRHWLLTGSVLAFFLLVACVEESTVPKPDSTPEPSPTVSEGPPPAPHSEGQPHGLGVTGEIIIDALEPRAFKFEQQFNEGIGHPAIRGFATIGPYFTVYAVGSPLGVIEFSLSTHWSSQAEPPISAILSIVDLVTPNWKGASEWVGQQVDDLAGQDDVDRIIIHGNYRLSVYAYMVGEYPGIQVDASPRFASCADALAAQDWTTKGSVGNERGYAGWRVPSEPDPDGDNTVCENIQE